MLLNSLRDRVKGSDAGGVCEGRCLIHACAGRHMGLFIAPNKA
jgi:hypothetical protein